MHTSAKHSVATLLLLATTTFSATSVMATTAPTHASTASTAAGAHANLSPEQQQIHQADVRAQEGRDAMSYIVAAHRLLSGQHADEAKQYLEQAKGLLTKLKSSVTGGNENASGRVPIYSQLGVKEGVEITAQLKQQLGETHLDAVRGNHEKVVEALKAVDIELQYSFVDLPVAATLEKVESALKSLSAKEPGRAGEILADAEAGLIHDSIVVNAVDENPAG